MNATHLTDNQVELIRICQKNPQAMEYAYKTLFCINALGDTFESTINKHLENGDREALIETINLTYHRLQGSTSHDSASQV